MKTLHYLLSRLATWIVPILLVIFSLSVNLTNSQLHKSTLKSSSFYNKLSNELQSSELKSEDIKKGFTSILVSSVLKDLATPGWLQNLFEKNIDGTSDWLSGNTSDLGLYIPSKEIETSISKSLDNKVNQVKQSFGSDIPTCNIEQSQTIKRQGFNLDNQFCLPEEVKSGNQKLTEFIGLSDKDTQNSEFLDKLVTNNSLNPFSDTVNAKELPNTNPVKKVFFDSLNRVRSSYIFIVSIRLYLLLAVLILFILSFVLAKLADRNMLKDIKRFLWRSATGTIVLVALITLTFGGSIYLTSFAQSLLLPGITSEQLINLITFEIIKFVFNVFSLAVYIAIGFFVLFGLIVFLEKVGILNKFNKINKKIQETTKSETKSNTTFDRQFQNILLDKIEAQPGTNFDINTQEISNNFNSETFDNNTQVQQQSAVNSILDEQPAFVTPNQNITNAPVDLNQPTQSFPESQPTTVVENNPAQNIKPATESPNPRPKIPGF